MTSRFTVRRLAALVLSAAIVASACNSDKVSDDDPPLFSAEVPAAAPTEPTVAPTAPPAPTIAAPAPTPPAEPAPPPAPTNYSEVGPDYATAHASLLATGRETVDALLSGDAATPYARLNEELQAAFSEHELQAVLQELHGDRVRFTLHLEGDDGETNAAFDGRLSDGTNLRQLRLRPRGSRYVLP